jgi:hypothetical protein
VFPSPSPLSSTTSATEVLFGGFAGTTGLSDFPRPCVSGVRPWPSPSGPHPCGWEGGHGISRFSRMEIPHMHRFFDRAGSADSSRIAPPTMLPSALSDGVGTPTTLISRLHSWPARTPVNASLRPHGTPTHDSEPPRIATPYGVELSHLLLHAGLSRRFPPSSPSSVRSRPRAHPTHDAGCVSAGTRRRNPGNPSRRWR